MISRMIKCKGLGRKRDWSTSPRLATGVMETPGTSVETAGTIADLTGFATLANLFS
jgi:hypothetical protein